MATISLLRLFIIFLGFYNLFCLNAVPTTRSVSLMHATQFSQVSTNTHLVTTEDQKKGLLISHGRMVVELNDYPGSGANNRHTPRPQFTTKT